MPVEEHSLSLLRALVVARGVKSLDSHQSQLSLAV